MFLTMLERRSWDAFLTAILLSSNGILELGGQFSIVINSGRARETKKHRRTGIARGRAGRKLVGSSRAVAMVTELTFPEFTTLVRT